MSSTNIGIIRVSSDDKNHSIKTQETVLKSLSHNIKTIVFEGTSAFENPSYYAALLKLALDQKTEIVNMYFMMPDRFSRDSDLFQDFVKNVQIEISFESLKRLRIIFPPKFSHFNLDIDSNTTVRDYQKLLFEILENCEKHSLILQKRSRDYNLLKKGLVGLNINNTAGKKSKRKGSILKILNKVRVLDSKDHGNKTWLIQEFVGFHEDKYLVKWKCQFANCRLTSHTREELLDDCCLSQEGFNDLKREYESKF